MAKRFKAHYLFGKTSLPKDIDSSTSQVLNELQNVTNRELYLKDAYSLVSKRFEGGRVKTFSRIWQLFSVSIEDLINRSGFMHCTNQNYVLTNILVKSGLFDEKDIKPRWTLVWYCTPHQYLQVTIGKETYTVDCWARHYGIPFGSYAKGFNTTPRKSFTK